ncbi:MAG: DUF4905 domain-containing protein [Cyclobacteriaceae bacterium]|jgi:hypothetical protein|nr:DUF4905 domain-containing protein [Cyclobacteriaceae bacterium]
MKTCLKFGIDLVGVKFVQNYNTDLNLTSDVGFSWEFINPIWLIKVDQVASQLGIELRSEETMEHYFVVIHVYSYEVTKIKIPIKMDWWSTLLGIKGNQLIIGVYQNQRNPGPITLMRYDWKKNEVLEEIPDFQLSELTDTFIKGKVFKEQAIEYLEISIGDERNIEEILLPTIFTSATPPFETVATYLNRTNREPKEEVAYLEVDDHILILYYLQNKDLLDKHLLWLKKEKVVQEFILDDQVQGLSAESFMVLGKKLIFVQNRKNIKIYDL